MRLITLLLVLTSAVSSAEHAEHTVPTKVSPTAEAKPAAVDAKPSTMDSNLQPTLPPEQRTLRLAPAGNAHSSERVSVDRAGLASDIEALTRSVQRVEKSLGKTTAPGNDEDASQPSDHAGAGAAAGPSAAPVISERYGQALSAVHQGGELLIDADLKDEPLEMVLKELLKLSGSALEDAVVPGMKRGVDLRVRGIPWQACLDRLLGQAGLSWRLTGSGAAERIALTNAPDSEDDERAAERALERAAADGNSAFAAEARWLLANRRLKAGEPVEAMRRFNDLVQVMSRSREPAVRVWVQRSIRGIGDCMAGLKQWSEARSVYRNYIARAVDGDPDVPQVYLAAAEAGRRQGLAKQDPVAFDEAVDDLHALLEKYGDDPHRSEVPSARLMIGGLLYNAQRWLEAETQLSKYVADAGGRSNDTTRFQLADCAFQLARYEIARTGFEDLLRRYRAGTGDAEKALYEQAAQAIGLCYLREAQPRFVHALFAFQRAQSEFPKSKLSADLLLNIARCYAEIEREDEAVAALWDMLKIETPQAAKEGTSSTDQAQAQEHLDEAMGQLLGRISEYPGPVRAKALFYIAQAGHRHAERERTQRGVLAAQAIGNYERVLSEKPSPELRDATRVGLARACFLAGNDERGELELINVLKDPGLGDRDRAYAARLLGEHFRAQGKSREAIKAFQGIVE
jgi:tetratricopeptide (TPR) repeat protein